MLYSIKNNNIYTRYLYFVIWLLSISACGSFSTSAHFDEPDWRAQGKLAIQTGQQDGSKNHTVSFRWRQHKASSLIEFFSPLGNRLFLIQKTPNKIILVDQYGAQTESDSIAAMAQVRLGIELPIDNFAELMFENISAPALLKIVDAGWQVQRSSYVRGRLNRLVLLHANGSRVIILVKNFEV